MTVAQKQAIRTQRARQQAQTYSFRRVQICGVSVVYVINERSGDIYSVAQGRCNCGDYRKRCLGTELRCKHVEMASAWEQSQPAQCGCGAAVSPSEAVVSRRALGEVQCAQCREEARKPYLKAPRVTDEQFKRDWPED